MAPAPTDIYWDNLSIAPNEKNFKRLLSNFIMILLLGLSLPGLIAINKF